MLQEDKFIHIWWRENLNYFVKLPSQKFTQQLQMALKE